MHHFALWSTQITDLSPQFSADSSIFEVARGAAGSLAFCSAGLMPRTLQPCYSNAEGCYADGLSMRSLLNWALDGSAAAHGTHELVNKPPEKGPERGNNS